MDENNVKGAEDLAQNEEFKQEEEQEQIQEKSKLDEAILNQTAGIKFGETITIMNTLDLVGMGQGQAKLMYGDMVLGIVQDGKIQYTNNAKTPEVEQMLKQLNEELEQRQKQEEQKQEEEQPEQEDEMVDEEKDDEKPDLEDDKDSKKEEIAKKYNLNVRNIVHIANDERVTENERFKGLVEWSKDYDDVYVLPGEDEYSYKFIGNKKGQIEEIQTSTNKEIGGKNPDITIKRIDGEKITEISPIAMYEVDSNTAIAIVKDEHGYPETIYCRQQEGNSKEYWGSVIPEASGKNVQQESPEVRSFMDYRNTSGLDLNKKADELSRQEELEERGLPSRKQGVQVEEIDGSHQQNRELNIEDIAEDLMKRDGIFDRATVPPGFYEHKAEKVLVLMEENENLTYEQAVEQIENQGQREDGGRTPGEKRDRRS